MNETKNETKAAAPKKAAAYVVCDKRQMVHVGKGEDQNGNTTDAYIEVNNSVAHAGPNGRHNIYKPGDVIPDLTEEQAKRLLSLGAIEKS